MKNLLFLCLFIYTITIHTTSASDMDGDYLRIGGEYSILRTEKTHVVVQDGIEEWAVYGAIQPIFEDQKLQSSSNGIDKPGLIALRETFSDNGILPTNPLSGLAATDSRMRLTATPGEYEPASFVIQSGKYPIDKITIDVSTLAAKSGATIPPSAFDIRIVKVWYQAASQMRRIARGERKRLVPELLLHNDDLVRVDQKNHLNLVRILPLIEDTKKLLPFSLPAHTNKQIWLTFHVPEETPAAEYHGSVTVYLEASNTTESLQIPLTVNILPFQLETTRNRIGIFYLGRLTSDNRPRFGARGKNAEQMQLEFQDMKDHGVNLIGLDHQYDPHRQSQSLLTLKKTIEILQNAQFPTDELIYVDWAVLGSESRVEYQKKISAITKTLAAKKIRRVGIYNADEKKYDYLIARKYTFDIAHDNNAFNIVAVTKPAIALSLGTLLDVAIVGHDTPTNVLNMLTRNGTTPLAYGVPHAAEERPATVRFTYGYGMKLKGFKGVFSYAYQAGDCWDDWFNWGKQNYRANCVAYPTVAGPIPTVQWEAFREATDDLRYLETYARITGKDADRLLNDVIATTGPNAGMIREKIIEKILSHTVNTIH